MKKSAMLGFTLFLIYLTTDVSANSPTLSSEDILVTMDIFRRLDAIERQGQEQHVKVAALREENVQLRDANAKLAQRVQILEDFQKMKIEDFVREKNENNGENEELDEGGASYKDVQNGQADESNVSAGKGGRVLGTKERQESVPTHGHNRIRQSNQGSTVAFFATTGGANAEHLGQHQAVLFDNIVTNIGQGYSNITGFFIAPISGIYVFSTTILVISETARFSFVVNGQEKTFLYSDSSDAYETTSQTAIFHLSKGDDVSIQNDDADKYVKGPSYSTFSGFLLVPVHGDFIVG